MSTNWESLLRSLAVVILIAVFSYAENATNLTAAIGASWAYIVASIAGVALNVVDKMYSPDGTVLGGTVGVRK